MIYRVIKKRHEHILRLCIGIYSDNTIDLTTRTDRETSYKYNTQILTTPINIFYKK